jgi:hypothetical protein
MQLAVVSIAVSKLAQAKMPQKEARAFTGRMNNGSAPQPPARKVGNLEQKTKRQS